MPAASLTPNTSQFDASFTIGGGIVIDWHTRQRSDIEPDIHPALGHRMASSGDRPVKQANSSFVVPSRRASANAAPSWFSQRWRKAHRDRGENLASRVPQRLAQSRARIRFDGRGGENLCLNNNWARTGLRDQDVWLQPGVEKDTCVLAAHPLRGRPKTTALAQHKRDHIVD